MSKHGDAARKAAEPEVLPDEGEVVVFVEKDGEEGQLQLLRVDEFAFDEMNLVEIPFCTLQKKASDKTSIDLSPGGEEYLESIGKKHTLPTSLAEPTVLGLLWLTKSKNGFNSPKVTFTLRELVEEFMHPGRYNKYRAGGKLMISVERELHRIAATRLHSNRWYDRGLEKHVEIDAAIIDSITVRQEGGKNSPRVLEIVWGNKVFQSVRNQYTKNFDVKTWLQISQPLDRRLYRWLDRQLYSKPQQTVRSCHTWAKHKMLMQCYKIDKGGRTASSYILDKVTESLKRLNGLNFGVRLVVDKSRPDFEFRFERITHKPLEVFDQDETGNLVFEFKKLFHGTKKRGRMKEADRKVAADWIESYGFEKSMLMVKRCKELYLARKSGQEPLYAFGGLEFYVTRAEADLDRKKEEEAGQLDLTLERERREKWGRYVESMLAEADRTLDLEELQAEAEGRVGDLNLVKTKSGFARDKVLEIELKRLKLERVGAVPEEEFMGFWSDEDLAQALAERHGSNPLG